MFEKTEVSKIFQKLKSARKIQNYKINQEQSFDAYFGFSIKRKLIS